MPDPTPPRSKGSSSAPGGLETLETADAAEVNAVEDHLELAGAQLDAAGVGGRLGEVIASRLQALAPQAQPVAAPVQHLESIFPGDALRGPCSGADRRRGVENLAYGSCVIRPEVDGATVPRL